MHILLLISKSIALGSETGSMIFQSVVIFTFEVLWGSKSVISYSWQFTCLVISDYEFP